VIFGDVTSKEEPLKTVPLHGKNRAEDILQIHCAVLVEINVCRSTQMALKP
jgi:hypothetical protein